jgi:leucyl aminopeptidase
MPDEVPQFSASTARLADVDVDLLFVPVFEDGPDGGDAGTLDAAVGGEWTRARDRGEFTGRLYDVFVSPATDSGWRARRVAFVGAGRPDAADPERQRRIAAVCGYAARQRGARSIAIASRRLSPRMVADGVSAAEFDGATYKSGPDRSAGFPARVVVVVPGGDARAADEAVRAGRTIAMSANFTRSLANEPGNLLPPREFARRIQAGVAGPGLTVEVLDEHRLKELGMRLLLGVAQGSAEPPRLIVIRYEPAGAPQAPVVGLVGKGVTFDSGGISIKPADGMDRMKDDMAGGAAVAGAIQAVARLGGTHRAIGVIPSVENMPGGRATRPGDVIVGASGTSVEVLNTDAEGRLILADALWYAQTLGATHLVDVATLTGACMVALGRHVSGLFGSSDGWVDVVRAAAARAGDRVWPMPIYEETQDELKSEIADLINSAGRAGGAITAAAFLREFAGDRPWAHLDIAGTAWADVKQPYQPKGSTGVAVRTLIELAMTGGQPATS